MKWTVAMLFISFIVAVPLMLTYNSLREAMDVENHEELKVAGLPSYSLMHAYTLFLPVLCYSVRAVEGKKKVIAFILLAIMCFVIYDTFVTTSLVLMILVLLFTLLHSDKKKSLSWFVISGAVVFSYILYQTGFFISLIDAIMPAFEGTAVEPKLLDMRDSMMQGQLTGASLTGRQDYHSNSIESFFQNPLFGGERAGGHSSLMDRLGGMGLMVGVPFIMIFVSQIKTIKPLFKTRLAKTFFWVGIVVSLVYLYNKGNWGCESWLFFMVIMPIGLLEVENSVTQKHL